MADISDPLERKYLVQDLLREAESDEEIAIESDKEDKTYDAAEAKSLYNEVDIELKHEMKEWQKYVSTGPRAKHNTGPKGVKADYEEAKRIMKRLNETKLLKQREMLRAANGVLSGTPSVSYTSTKAKAKKLNGAEAQENVEDILNDLKKFRIKEFEAINHLYIFLQHTIF